MKTTLDYDFIEFLQLMEDNEDPEKVHENMLDVSVGVDLDLIQIPEATDRSRSGAEDGIEECDFDCYLTRKSKQITIGCVYVSSIIYLITRN